VAESVTRSSPARGEARGEELFDMLEMAMHANPRRTAPSASPLGGTTPSRPPHGVSAVTPSRTDDVIEVAAPPVAARRAAPALEAARTTGADDGDSDLDGDGGGGSEYEGMGVAASTLFPGMRTRDIGTLAGLLRRLGELLVATRSRARWPEWARAMQDVTDVGAPGATLEARVAAVSRLRHSYSFLTPPSRRSEAGIAEALRLLD